MSEHADDGRNSTRRNVVRRHTLSWRRRHVGGSTISLVSPFDVWHKSPSSSFSSSFVRDNPRVYPYIYIYILRTPRRPTRQARARARFRERDVTHVRERGGAASTRFRQRVIERSALGKLRSLGRQFHNISFTLYAVSSECFAFESQDCCARARLRQRAAEPGPPKR